jgi:hypothetical protein
MVALTMLAGAEAEREGAAIGSGAEMPTEGTGAEAETGAAQPLPAMKNCNTLSMYRDRSRDRFAVTCSQHGKV